MCHHGLPSKRRQAEATVIHQIIGATMRHLNTYEKGRYQTHLGRTGKEEQSKDRDCGNIFDEDLRCLNLVQIGDPLRVVFASSECDRARVYEYPE